jgi:hypothetical protein
LVKTIDFEGELVCFALAATLLKDALATFFSNTRNATSWSVAMAFSSARAMCLSWQTEEISFKHRLGGV